MTQLNIINVKLRNSQISKLKSDLKNVTEVFLSL